MKRNSLTIVAGLILLVIFGLLAWTAFRYRRQIAGMVGAFGNVGGVIFLTIFATTDAQTLFLVAAIGSGLALAFTWLFIEDPKGQIAEEMPDGTIALIDVT